MSARRLGWAVPVGLFALCFVPVASGTLRLVQLAGGPEIMPADDRWAGWPVALVVHIVGSAVFALVGAFQLVPRSAAGTPAGTGGRAGCSRWPG